MDVFQMLEALQPQNKVVTIQVSSPKDYFSYILTLAPSVVAILALLFSAWQFKSSIRNQIKLAQINARLSTDIELKKEWCRDVRKLCVECLSAGIESHLCGQRSTHILEGLEKKGTFDEVKYRVHFDAQNNNFYKMLESQSCLLLYLDPIEHGEFIELLQTFTTLVGSGNLPSSEVGTARASVLDECRKIIHVRNREISQISDDIS